MSQNPIAFQELVAPPSWHTVDIISDLHLQADRPATVEAFRGYLQTTPADALFILGDLFEVWVGDDAAALPGFEADCAALLREAAQRRPVYFMHGNRDFLVGRQFAAQANFTLLADPTVLVFMDQRWLLSHGDELCLEDTEYLRFRAQVRSAAWQQAVLSQPLEQRRALARSVRSESEARQQAPDMVWADVDAPAALDWLTQAAAPVMIHGHTHRPAVHALDGDHQRIVLSDWDLDAHPPRAQVLCLSATGAKRVDLR